MVKKYKRNSEYSYSLGTTLTFELLNAKPPEFDSDMLKLKIIFAK